MPLQTILKMSIIYAVIDLSSIGLGLRQTRRKPRSMTTVSRSAWTWASPVISLEVNIYVKHELII